MNVVYFFGIPIPADTFSGAAGVALAYTTAILVLFIKGVITTGKNLDRAENSNAELRVGLREMAAAKQRENDIDQAVETDRAKRSSGRG